MTRDDRPDWPPFFEPPHEGGWRPEDFTHGQQPDPSAGYGVSGQPYSGHTPEPAPLPHDPWPTWQIILLAIAAALILIGVAILGAAYLPYGGL